MASTAQTIITRAMRRLRITSVAETPDAAELADALDVLNGMMFGWAARGVDVEHTAYALGDDQALGDQFELALEYLLAQALAGHYEMELSRTDDMEARRWWRNLAAAYLVLDEVSFDRSITDLPSQEARRYLGYTA